MKEGLNSPAESDERGLEKDIANMEKEVGKLSSDVAALTALDALLDRRKKSPNTVDWRQNDLLKNIFLTD